jgi:uncharacterized protein YecE (DUF72 family)
MQIRLGTSGWSYKDWIGNFYPENAQPSQFLSLYAGQLNTVEIDSTFYGTPSLGSVEKWKRETPDDFMFAPKFPKNITHDKALLNCAEDVVRFLDRMALLEHKLGPLLLQFPYGFRSDSFIVLQKFLLKLPVDFRYAIEVRHKSWLSQRFYDLLRERNVALTLIDHPWMPRLDIVTSNLVYIRWLGDRKKITENFNRIYIDRTYDLERWKVIIEKISIQDLILYGFFNNHYAGHSPTTLRMFEKILKGTGSINQ